MSDVVLSTASVEELLVLAADVATIGCLNKPVTGLLIQFEGNEVHFTANASEERGNMKPHTQTPKHQHTHIHIIVL